ncbi:MAG: CAP domain-containing protein [Christiangramia sp.]
MNKITFPGFILITCMVFLTSCSKDSIQDEVTAYDQVVTKKTNYTYNHIEGEIFDEINLYRKAIGLRELKVIAKISVESEIHNEYMINVGNVSHENFSQRASFLKNEIGAKTVAENVGYGYLTSKAVVNAWLKSKADRENIEGNYTHFGISVRQDANGKNYFTNIFIKK